MFADPVVSGRAFMTFDIGVLLGLARLDIFEPNAVLSGPMARILSRRVSEYSPCILVARNFCSGDAIWNIRIVTCSILFH